MPVKIATPDADGKIYHKVLTGQSFWAIAVTYGITIQDIEIWNNLSRSNPLRSGRSCSSPAPTPRATPRPRRWA